MELGVWVRARVGWMALVVDDRPVWDWGARVRVVWQLTTTERRWAQSSAHQGLVAVMRQPNWASSLWKGLLTGFSVTDLV